MQAHEPKKISLDQLWMVDPSSKSDILRPPKGDIKNKLDIFYKKYDLGSFLNLNKIYGRIFPDDYIDAISPLATFLRYGWVEGDLKNNFDKVDIFMEKPFNKKPLSVDDVVETLYYMLPLSLSDASLYYFLSNIFLHNEMAKEGSGMFFLYEIRKAFIERCSSCEANGKKIEEKKSALLSHDIHLQKITEVLNLIIDSNSPEFLQKNYFLKWIGNLCNFELTRKVANSLGIFERNIGLINGLYNV